MSMLLEQEVNVQAEAQAKRDNDSRMLLEQESSQNTILNEVLKENERNRIIMINDLTASEALQKSAVAALVQRLVEKFKIYIRICYR
jgi:hypothetical protein